MTSKDKIKEIFSQIGVTDEATIEKASVLAEEMMSKEASRNPDALLARPFALRQYDCLFVLGPLPNIRTPFNIHPDVEHNYRVVTKFLMDCGFIVFNALELFRSGLYEISPDDTKSIAEELKVNLCVLSETIIDCNAVVSIGCAVPSKLAMGLHYIRSAMETPVVDAKHALPMLQSELKDIECPVFCKMPFDCNKIIRD